MRGLPVNITANLTTPIEALRNFCAACLLTHSINQHHYIHAWLRYNRWLIALLLASAATVKLASHTAYAGEPSFAQTVPLGSPEITYSVAVGDLNGDGWLDIVQARYGGQSQVYLNNGHGDFPVTGIPVGNPLRTSSIALGDFNGDGWLDIVQTNDPETETTDTPQTDVYFNDGQGNFVASRTPVGDGVGGRLVVGDLNGDGWLDIVVGQRIFFNMGQGHFPTTGIPVGAVFGSTSTIGDLNRDGWLDIVQGGYGTQSFVYLNQGQGNFATTGIPVGKTEYTTNIGVGDLNGDGWLDIVQGNNTTNMEGAGSRYSYVYFNDGQGNFAATGIPFGNGEATWSIALGDLNGDGWLDITQDNHVYLNDRSGHFPITGIPWGNGESTWSIALGDLNGDGWFDIVQGNNNGQSYFLLNDGQAGFRQRSQLGGRESYSLAVGDLNGDGWFDIVQGNADVVSTCCAPSYVYLNDGAGHFPGTGSQLGGNSNNTNSIALGDLNRDGWLDIIQGNEFGQDYIYYNEGQGRFPTTGIALGKNGGTKSIVVGDLNGDEWLDIVQGRSYGQSYVYLNDGQGNFPTASNAVDSVTATQSIALGDFNLDGWLDLVQGNLGQSYVFLNDKQGRFLAPANPFGSGETTWSIVVGDFNGDGWLDIIQGNYGRSYLYFNDRHGNFTQRIQFGNGESTRGVAAGDLNGDGLLDIVQGNGVWNYQGRQSYLYLNDGQNSFRQRIPLGDVEATVAVALGDLNGDSALDLLQGNEGQSYIYWNTLKQTKTLINQAPQLTVIRPVETANANFFSSPVVLGSPTIPITYTLFDSEGDHVGRVEASYSPDGGGRWLPAVAATDTVTQNLATGQTVVRAHLSPPFAIPTLASPSLQARLRVTEAIALANTEVWVSITGTQNSAIGIALQSPMGKQVPLVATGQAQGQNFQGTRFLAWATTSIVSGTAPYTGTYRPSGDLTTFKGETSNGDWTLVITNTGVMTGTLMGWGLRLASPPITYTFPWDTFASDFFGQSDNVVVRIVAYSQPISTTIPRAGDYYYPNTVPGASQWPYVSATTFPFRVRGTQVRVLDGSGNPVPNAVVYRLPRGAVAGAEPMPNVNQPLTTTVNGYLTGRGALALGDQLLALAPITHTLNYTLYATSGIPNDNGLTMTAVSQAGVQTLTVSAAHPLMLFDVDVSLEWDAGSDGVFYDQLKSAFERASAILYDVSDGQVALGEVRIHPKREAWLSADIVIYANNNLRPRATMGGLVNAAQDEIAGLRGRLPNAYVPGQVRISPIWDPFGQNAAELTQDWQRALAHELAHYLLYLPDNYLGVENGILRITNCQGSFMTDAYNPGYSELLTPPQWHTPNDPTRNPCLRTVAATLLTGRSDWETVAHFYPELHIPNPPLQGPALLPLNVTRVRFVTDTSAVAQPVAARNYDLRDESGSVTVLRQAQAYVLQGQGTATTTDDALLYLGTTGVGSDRIMVRGALAGDKVCVINNAGDPMRTGCTAVTAQSTSIQLFPVPGWQPDIEVTPLTSTTFQITVTQAVNVGQLYAQLLPAYGPVGNAAAIQSVSQPLTPVDATRYTGIITTVYPVFEGFVRVYAAGAPEQQQAITQFFLSSDWGPTRAWGGVNRAWGANIRALEAPTASGDGKVTILNLTDLLADTGTSVLQAVTDLPYLPLWLTPIGAGYRFAASNDLPRTLMFQYNQRDVPPGYEATLAIYYLPAGETSWQRLATGPLATGVDVNDNLAVAVMPTNARGAGIYALLATVALPPLSPGWNPFNYPVTVTQSVTRTLAALGAAYTTVYAYQPDMPLPWPVYDRTIDPTFAPLVNTLTTMTFGHNYLIYATQVVTPYISVIDGSTEATKINASALAGLVEPPALFYGKITPSPGFVVNETMVVKAKIGAVTCGESQVQRWQEDLAFVIQVQADRGDGCGKAGQTVQFEIGGQMWPFSTIWNNHQANRLIPNVLNVYLPIVSR